MLDATPAGDLLHGATAGKPCLCASFPMVPWPSFPGLLLTSVAMAAPPCCRGRHQVLPATSCRAPERTAAGPPRLVHVDGSCAMDLGTLAGVISSPPRQAPTHRPAALRPRDPPDLLPLLPVRHAALGLRRCWPPVPPFCLPTPAASPAAVALHQAPAPSLFRKSCYDHAP